MSMSMTVWAPCAGCDCGACCSSGGTGPPLACNWVAPDPFVLADPFVDDFNRVDASDLGDPYILVPWFCEGDTILFPDSFEVAASDALAATGGNLTTSSVDVSSIYDPAGFFIEATVQVPPVSLFNGSVGISFGNGVSPFYSQILIEQTTSTLVFTVGGTGLGISAISAGAPGAWVTIRMEINATAGTIDFLLNGVVVFSGTSLNLAGVYAAMTSSLSGVVGFDAFQAFSFGTYTVVVGNFLETESASVLTTETDDELELE